MKPLLPLLLMLLGMSGIAKPLPIDDGKVCSYYSASTSSDYATVRAECLKNKAQVAQVGYGQTPKLPDPHDPMCCPVPQPKPPGDANGVQSKEPLPSFGWSTNVETGVFVAIVSAGQDHDAMMVIKGGTPFVLCSFKPDAEINCRKLALALLKLAPRTAPKKKSIRKIRVIPDAERVQ